MGEGGDSVLTLCMNSFVVILSVSIWEFEVSLISLEVWRVTELINLSLDNLGNDGSGVHDKTTVSFTMLIQHSNRHSTWLKTCTAIS